MGSEDLKLERDAERRLAHEHHRQERLEHRIMNAPTSTITHVPTEPKRWRAPEFTQPVVVKPRDLKPLGELRGYHWFRVAQYDAEWAERLVRLSDADTLPDGLLIQYDDHGERSYSRLDVFAPGSFAKFTAEPAPRIGPPATPPLRLVDALPALHAPRARVKIPQRLGGSSTGIMDGSTEPLVHAPKVRLFGVAAIVADLGRRGVVVSLATDRASVVVRSRTDILSHDANLVQFVRDAVPLLLGHLRGEPSRCTVGAHDKGIDDTAITILVGGAPCCQSHLREKVAS
jgi:hypothetical protein